MDAACVLCASEDDPADEPVIPKWLLCAFDLEEGSTTVSVAEEAGDKQSVAEGSASQVGKYVRQLGDGGGDPRECKRVRGGERRFSLAVAVAVKQGGGQP